MATKKQETTNLVFYDHASQDVAKTLDEEGDAAAHRLKNVKMPKSYNCEKCSAFCKPRKCAKCQKVVYCSSECQKADWPAHKLVCKDLANSLKPSDHVFAKAVLKLAARTMGDQKFMEQLLSIAFMAMDLHKHPERASTQSVNFLWDLVPLRTASEYRDDRPAKERVNNRGQRYMLELVDAQTQPIAKQSVTERNMLAQHRNRYLQQNRERLRGQGEPEDSMEGADYYHIPLFFHVSKFAGRLGAGASILFSTTNRDTVALKYQEALGDINKLSEASGKIVNEADYIRYVIRLLNSEIVTSQTGRNFRTSISLDEAEGDD
ncbi:hypothetical protein PENSPDRAFT_479157 [Peniophora sp. CONT]|nr:hypothetical protein PENSPDRAFT_479157 [Peniophora sp. CONT]